MADADRTAEDGTAQSPILAVAGLTKRFTGTLALDRVDFDLRRGEVHALLGQNGAGKSTLIKILAGVYPADAGEIRFAGRPVDLAAETLPISFIHQDLGLVEWMTVGENVALLNGYPRLPLGLISWPQVRKAAADALGIMGSDLDPDARITGLPAAERSLVAIGRALALKASILVLDEPTAALPEADVERLLQMLRRLRASGIGIIYVTHRLDEVFRIADRITVLRDGRRVATVEAQATSPQDLIGMIVGRSMSDAFVRPAPAAERTVLEVRDAVSGHVGPVSFTIREGETLGLVGLRGAGHHTIGRAIFGQVPLASGHVAIDGTIVDPTDPADAMRKGIGFVSSRRAEESIAANMAVRENIYLNPAATGKDVLQIVGRAAERGGARAALGRFSIKAHDTEQAVATLSGGNQQKVVVARWMEARVRLLVLEEPTIGVDVSSKAEIYHLLKLSLQKGMAVLLISSDFEEVERICHRALVFSRGRMVTEILQDELTVAQLTASAAGGASVAQAGAALPGAAS
ncbi:MAG TPA: sugar ABC transporter ATP-binding protein [Candidatus Acidoferrum sp.]|nr:sugar ABC transporter ATP-binding protein [Candidatus Acidoferrum sp.]